LKDVPYLSRLLVQVGDFLAQNPSASRQKYQRFERNRRALVREAEGKKQATELDADAQLYAAQKEAEAKKIRADAEAYAVGVVSTAIAAGGQSAVEFEVRKIQAQAVQELGRSDNTKIVVLPTDVLSSLSGALGGIASRLAAKE